MQDGLVLRIGFVGIVLWLFPAKAETFEQATTLSGALHSIVEEERAARKPSKPIEEMSDAEVIVQAATKVVDKVHDIEIGTLAAAEAFTEKAIGSVAKRLRDRESTKAIQRVTEPRSSSQTRTSYERDEAARLNGEKDVSKASNSPTAVSTRDNAMSRKDAVGEIGDESESRIVTIAIFVLVVAVCLYGIAYVRVKAGTMVVYASWSDFAMSSAWAFLVPVGYGCEYATSGVKDALWVIAMALKAGGVLSAIWMVCRAFRNKRTIDVLIAIPARTIVSVLALLACAKLKEAWDGIKDHRKGVVDGVLIPLGLALLVFDSLVRPMVEDRRP